MQYKHAFLGLLALGVTAVAVPLPKDASKSVNVTRIVGTENLQSLGHLEERRLNLTEIFAAENGTENSHSLHHLGKRPLGHPTKRPLRHLEKRIHDVKVSCKAFCEEDRAVEEVCNGPCSRAKNDKKEKFNRDQRKQLVKILWPDVRDWDHASRHDIKHYILDNLPPYWQKNQNPSYYEGAEDFEDEYGTIDEELDEEVDEEIEEELYEMMKGFVKAMKHKGTHKGKGGKGKWGKGGKTKWSKRKGHHH